MRRFVILLLLAGCGGGSSLEPNPQPPEQPPAQPPEQPPPPPPVLPGIAASVAFIAGTEQVARITEELPQAVVVRVSDQQALSVPNQLVNFVVVSGGGSVFAGSAQTNALGEARERWTLGTIAGEQILEARAVDQSTGDPIVFARLTATAKPGPTTELQLRNLPDYTLSVGDVLDLRNIVAYARDQYSNFIWAAADVGKPFFGVFEDIQFGVTFWHDSNAGNQVEIPGSRFDLKEPFDGTLYVWADGQRYGSIRLIVAAKE